MAEKKENKEEKVTPVAESKKGLAGILKSEILDNLLLGILILLGFKHQSDSNASGGREKQAPNWLMQVFPSLTRDDNNEYNLALDSHPDPATRTAAKKFRSMMEKEGIYDVEKYVVNLIKVWREFMERTKNPPPESKSAERIVFEKITVNDSVKAFFSELLTEKTVGGTEEEIYNRQKDRAYERDLLPKKHWLKKLREWFGKNKLVFFCYTLSVAFFISFIFSIIFK